MSGMKTSGDRKALILLAVMLCIWLAGATVPLAAALPYWTEYLLYGTEEQRAAIMWRSSSFDINGYHCYPYVAYTDTSPSSLPINITVFDDSGTNVYNLTFSMYFKDTGEIHPTWQVAKYNDTHELILVCAITLTSSQMYVKYYGLLCDGVTITQVVASTWYKCVLLGSTGTSTFSAFGQIFLTNLVECSSGWYAAFCCQGYDSVYANSAWGYGWLCATSDWTWAINVCGQPAYKKWYGLPYALKLGDTAVYMVCTGYLDRLDTTTRTIAVVGAVNEIAFTALGGTAAYTWTYGAMVSNVTYNPVSLAITACYYQCMVPLTNTTIIYYSAYLDGSTITRSQSNIVGVNDTVYYLDWQSGYTEGLTPWFVFVNTTGGTKAWTEAIVTLNSAGGIVSISYSRLGDVESTIQTAATYAWSPSWTEEPYGGTNHPDYAVGYFTTGDGGGKYYKVVLMGSMALIDISQYGLPGLTGSYYNVTYVANSNVTKFFDRNVTESFSNQMLTGEYIYLSNVNTTLLIGAYHTLYAGNISSYNSQLLIGSTTVSSGWSGWVVIVGLNYYQPQYSQVGIGIVPANKTAGAFYSVGVPTNALLSDIYNLTIGSSALPSIIYVGNVTLFQAAQNVAVTYSLAYTGGGGVNVSYINIATENVTMPTFNPTQYLFINASANYIAPVTNLGGTITLILETPWGPWLLAIIPIFIMILAGGSTGAVAAVLALAVSTVINFSVSTPVFRWGVLGVIAFITLLMLFDEGGKKRP
jgi:hypothetical protein